MEKIQQIREKLERIKEVCIDPTIGQIVDWRTALQYIRNEAKEALALIDEMSKTGVWVKIPPTNEHGDCNINCPLLKRADFFRAECYCNLMPNHDERPGPGCPRYKGVQNDQRTND